MYNVNQNNTELQLKFNKPVPWLRLSGAGLSLSKSRLDSRPVHVGIIIHIFLLVLLFFLSPSFCQISLIVFNSSTTDAYQLRTLLI
jgi:hypothetical protein